MTSTKLHPTLIYNSKKTIEEALEKLSKFNKVFVCRPTGFGKTYMLTQVAKQIYKENPNKRIAYIYPLDIIMKDVINKYGKNGADKEISEIILRKTDFISYQRMSREYNKYGASYWKEELKKYSIILLDEVHSAGSENFRNIYEGFRELVDNGELKMIGVTATPNRMDDTYGNSVLESIFDNIQVYEYTLANCIEDGIIDKMVIASRKYDIVSMAEDLRLKSKKECAERGITFDDDSYSVELSKMLKEYGTEAEMIIKYIQLAGYDFKDKENNDTKYFKFIVFFNNIEDVASNGTMVERWFNEAFNSVAYKKGLCSEKYTIRSHYLTSSDTEQNAISKVVKDKPTRFKYTDANKLLEKKLKQDYYIDLILTVNMTNMGYHDDNINGIMMLRGTRSEIVFYQQLGRAISVTSKHKPLIFDLVNNNKSKFWSKKDRTFAIEKGILSNQAGVNEKEEKDFSNYVVGLDGDYDACEEFLSRWSDVYLSIKTKEVFMYVDRRAPIVAIAADLNKTCTEVASDLLNLGITLRAEDAMFLYEKDIAEAEMSDIEDKKTANAIIFSLNSKEADNYHKEKGVKRDSLYRRIINLRKKGKVHTEYGQFDE